MFGKFDIRSNAVRTCVRVVSARPSRRRRVLRGALRRRRAYKPGLGGIARPDRLAARRRRYMHWIKTWAATTHGPYTVASYQRRRLASAPAAPTRNTVATDGCRSAREIERAQRTSADARLARLDVATCWLPSSGVAGSSDAVRASASSSGGEAAASPAFHRHRLFPGGWQEVLAALSAASEELLEPPAQSDHVRSAAAEELAPEPDVQASSARQLGHERVARDQVAARERD
jgi:hypothetical protein